jgi:hypothetical protein
VSKVLASISSSATTFSFGCLASPLFMILVRGSESSSRTAEWISKRTCLGPTR